MRTVPLPPRSEDVRPAVADRRGRPPRRDASVRRSPIERTQLVEPTTAGSLGALRSLVSTLFYELECTGDRYGLQVMCEGGGMTNATLIERI